MLCAGRAHPGVVATFGVAAVTSMLGIRNELGAMNGSTFMLETGEIPVVAPWPLCRGDLCSELRGEDFPFTLKSHALEVSHRDDMGDPEAAQKFTWTPGIEGDLKVAREFTRTTAISSRDEGDLDTERDFTWATGISSRNEGDLEAA